MSEHKSYTGPRPRGNAWRRTDLDQILRESMRGPDPRLTDETGKRHRNPHPRLIWPGQASVVEERMLKRRERAPL